VPDTPPVTGSRIDPRFNRLCFTSPVPEPQSHEEVAAKLGAAISSQAPGLVFQTRPNAPARDIEILYVDRLDEHFPAVQRAAASIGLDLTPPLHLRDPWGNLL
jgi:hypothetical protein